MSLCKYKDVFGKPNTGAHSFRIFNIAVVDVVLTILLAYVISKGFNLKFFKVLIVTFLVGIFFHYIFCVNSTVNNFIFQ